MDLQYFGGNCVSISGKGARLVVDDYLADLGLKPISKQGDVLLYTAKHKPTVVQAKLVVDGPGEFEIANLAITGITARGHMDEPGTNSATMFRIIVDDTTYLFTGNIYPELSDEQ